MPVNVKSRGVLDLARTVIVAAAIVLVPKTVLCAPYTIPSGSMEPTLMVGDYILVSKYPYGWSRHSLPFSPPVGQGRVMPRQPKRGDIVVFKKPSDGRTTLIKRLVGLPGDQLQVMGGVLMLNGKPVGRRFVSAGAEATPFGGAFPVARFRETLPGGRSYEVKSYGRHTATGNTGVYVVPAGFYFMLGDNRDDSLDSRFDPGKTEPGQSACRWNPELDRFLPPEEGAGYVPFDDLIGRADLVLFSWNREASLSRPWELLRWDRLFRSLGCQGGMG
jgi:signal peptidase I